MNLYTMEYGHPGLGTLTVASNGDSLCGLWMNGQKYFPNDSLRSAVHDPANAALRLAAGWLDAYFFGDNPNPLELPLALEGTAFQRAVWGQLLRVPYGCIWTYAQLALAVQEAGASSVPSARAVGTANGRNPISIIVPCHRIVGSNGSLTGYAGGVQRKRWLLEHEGVDVSTLKIPTRGTAL